MNLIKHSAYFDPTDVLRNDSIHVIGCGAIGSHVVTTLARLGVPRITLWDFDTVSAHNIANQEFYFNQIGMPKVDAVEFLAKQINPEIEIIKNNQAFMADEDMISGYVFMCVDNIEVRQQIVDENTANPTIKGLFDFRMRLTDAQHYGADWTNPRHKIILRKSMNFSRDEAKEATPVNACGSTLSVITTVRAIVSLGIANFIHLAQGKTINTMLVVDTDTMQITTM